MTTDRGKARLTLVVRDRGGSVSTDGGRPDLMARLEGALSALGFISAFRIENSRDVYFSFADPGEALGKPLTQAAAEYLGRPVGATMLLSDFVGIFAAIRDALSEADEVEEVSLPTIRLAVTPVPDGCEVRGLYTSSLLGELWPAISKALKALPYVSSEYEPHHFGHILAYRFSEVVGTVASQGTLEVVGAMLEGDVIDAGFLDQMRRHSVGCVTAAIRAADFDVQVLWARPGA